MHMFCVYTLWTDEFPHSTRRCLLDIILLDILGYGSFGAANITEVTLPVMEVQWNTTLVQCEHTSMRK